MAGDTSTGHHGSRLAHDALHLSMPLLRCLYVGVAMLGLIGTPLVALLWAPVIGMSVAAVVASIVGYCDSRWYAPRLLVTVCLVGAGAVPFVVGLALLQGVGRVVGALFFLLLSVAVMSGVHGLSTGDTTARAQVGARDDEKLSHALRLVALEVLFTQWWSALIRARGESAEGGRRRARLRTALLDEMERRDGEGFRRWLQEGAAEAPDRYLRGRGAS